VNNPKLIILRGNSGSGKSTVAKILQKKFGHETLLISQDEVRREMLWVRSGSHNKSMDLLNHLLLFGNANCDVTILEGILYSGTYQELFRQIEVLFKGQIFAYYFDLPFEETLKRNEQKQTKLYNVGEAEMRKWWRDKDFLKNISEKVLLKDMSLNDIVEQIYDDVK
jgi:predicted kinase